MIVYKSTCLENDKCYIGVTKKRLQNRISSHVSRMNHGSKYAFHCAMREHGIDKFKWEVMATAQTEQQLFELEKMYIHVFNSNGSMGYNMTDGGDTPMALAGDRNGMYGKTHAQEVRDKLSYIRKGKTLDEQFGEEKAAEIRQRLSKSRTGRRHSDETKNKMSANSKWTGNGHLIKGDKNPNYGNKWDDEQKAKASGINNPMYGVRRFGEDNPMFGKHHSDESVMRMREQRANRGNANYRRISEDVLRKIKSMYQDGIGIGEIARSISDNYNKVKRELIFEGLLQDNKKTIA